MVVFTTSKRVDIQQQSRAQEDDKQSLITNRDKLSRRARPLPHFPVVSWSLSALGALFLVVLPVVRSDSAQPHRRLQTPASPPPEWITSLPQDVVVNMNLTVDPCDDFYEFSCGAWLDRTEIPGDKGGVYMSFTRVNDENALVLKDLMTQGRPLIGELYNSCMSFSNTSDPLADKVSLSFLAPSLQLINTATTKDQLFQLAGNLSRAGPSFLTGLPIGADARAATTYILYASQTGLTLPDIVYYLDEKKYASVQDAFQAYIATLFRLVGQDAESAAALAGAVSSFEQQLARLYVPKETLQDPRATYNRMSVAQAAQLYPLLFAQYVDGLGLLTKLVANNTDVIVVTPSYFERAEELVANESVTLDTLKAVLQYQYISFNAGMLSAPYYNARFTFFAQKLSGQQVPTERWKLCLGYVTGNFPDLVGKYYALARLDDASEKLARDLVTEIQATLKQNLGQLDWLDESTRKAAVDKLNDMANLIGHSTHQNNVTYLLRSDVTLAENIRNIGEYEFIKAVARIGSHIDRTEWLVSGAMVNAYYQPTSNQIIFPAGILQPPLFSRSYHPARNFGAIGCVISHEMTHAFDSNGRFYGGDGNLHDWWSNDTAREFEKRAACLVAQYGKYEVQSAIEKGKMLGHVNGNFTLGENIADNGGVKLSFAAYHAFMNQQVKNINEGGNNLTTNAADRLFFVSYAQVLCNKATDASLTQQITSNSHSPEQWRINGVVSNSPDFANVFSCPAGAPMNPKAKCQLW